MNLFPLVLRYKFLKIQRYKYIHDKTGMATRSPAQTSPSFPAWTLRSDKATRTDRKKTRQNADAFSLSPAVRSRPNMIFIFSTACPLAPLSRLSIVL